MFGGRGEKESTVTCIACGVSIPRTDAREYDKHGDRWDRVDKTFEHLCKPCYRELCHQPRKGLESLLTDCGAGESDRETFLRQFIRRDEGVEEPER